MIKVFVVVLTVSCVMLVALALVAGGRGDHNLALRFIGYFFLTIGSIRYLGGKLSAKSTVIIVFFSFLLLQSYTIFLYFRESVFSLPIFLSSLVGILCGFLFAECRFWFARFMPVFFGSLLIIFMFLFGWDYWVHKVNHGTFSGRVDPYLAPAHFVAFDAQGEVLLAKDFTGKIFVLDFWTTTCGRCFEKFPKVQAMVEKYENDSAVAIFAVNIPIEEDRPNQAFEMINRRNYSFPVVIAQDGSMSNSFGVTRYPTAIVIDRKGLIVFRGDIEGAERMLDELIANARWLNEATPLTLRSEAER